MSTLRIPATYCELVIVLGKVLRTHLNLRIWHTECWTFKYSDSLFVDCYEGKGNFLASLPPEHCSVHRADDLVEAEVVCQQDKRVEPGWEIEMKLKFPNGKTTQHTFKVDTAGELIS